MGLEHECGGRFHLKPNVGSKPIANVYHEGKIERWKRLRPSLEVTVTPERGGGGGFTRC